MVAIVYTIQSAMDKHPESREEDREAGDPERDPPSRTKEGLEPNKGGLGKEDTGQVVHKGRRRKEGRHGHMLPPSLGQIWHSRLGHSPLDQPRLVPAWTKPYPHT